MSDSANVAASQEDRRSSLSNREGDKKDGDKKVEPKSEAFATEKGVHEEDGGNMAVTEKRLESAGISDNYERKVFILNRVMNDHIGMGRFQWSLFLLCGAGEFLPA